MILETVKSLRWSDYFLYSIMDPRELYRRIKQKDPDPFILSFIIPAIATLFDILVLSLMGKETGFFYYKLSYGWILVFIYAVFKIVIYSSLVDMTAQFFGCNGNIREVLTVVNFSIFPRVFFLPLFYRALQLLFLQLMLERQHGQLVFMANLIQVVFIYRSQQVELLSIESLPFF